VGNELFLLKNCKNRQAFRPPCLQLKYYPAQQTVALLACLHVKNKVAGPDFSSQSEIFHLAKGRIVKVN